MNRIPKNEPLKLKPSTCPYCKTMLDISLDMTVSEPRAPKFGDMIVCHHCGELARFGKDMEMMAIPPVEKEFLLTQNKTLAGAVMLIKGRRAAEDPEQHTKYAEQLDAMSDAVVDWRVKNKDSNLMIQYNYQKEVGLISTLKDAIDNGFVSINDDARNMFKELGWLDIGPAMPTVLMARVVLDHLFDKE